MLARPAAITQLLLAWGDGDEAALHRMIPLVHAWSTRIRSKRAAERGGGAANVALDDVVIVPSGLGGDLVPLDDALEALASVDERKSRMIELRFFGGLSVKETAAVFHVSPDTVKRDWRFAKAWLLRELRGGAGRKHDERSNRQSIGCAPARSHYEP